MSCLHYSTYNSQVSTLQSAVAIAEAFSTNSLIPVPEMRDKDVLGNSMLSILILSNTKIMLAYVLNHNPWK